MHASSVESRCRKRRAPFRPNRDHRCETYEDWRQGDSSQRSHNTLCATYICDRLRIAARRAAWPSPNHVDMGYCHGPPAASTPLGWRMLQWEASDPYLYIRTTPEGRVIAAARRG